MSTTIERDSNYARDVFAEFAGPPVGPPRSPRRSRLRSYLRRNRSSARWFLPVFVLGLIVQIVNIAGSPARIDDEGTYTAQAWAVAKLGELTHYTYWYDHPPLGWVQLAGYAQITGAFERYDTAVLAGREFMVVMVMISAALLWVLARRLRFGRPTAALAVVLFTVSPLALQFHRSVYLDNIATTWLLAAIVLAISRRHQLAAFIGSAVCFGIAVLSKETFLLLLPLVAWLMWRNAHPSTRRYTLTVAASVLVLVGALYVLLAAIKGEVFPGGGRVSLFDGVFFQLTNRQSSGSVTDPGSLIDRTLGMWWQLDPVLISAGLAAGVGALFIRRLRPFAIAVLALVAFMFRPGGYLPVPYIIALLPFGALLIAGLVHISGRLLRKRSVAGRGRRVVAGILIAAAAASAVIAAPLWTVQLRGFFLADLNEPLDQAAGWVEGNVGRDSRLIVDDSMWVDLVNAGFARDNVTWYYKVDTDPAVQALSPNGWRDSDYVITTDSMRTLIDTFPQVSQAVANSTVVASFGTGTQEVDVRRIDSSGADQAAAAARQATAARSTAGTQLASNRNLTMPSGARDLVTGGLVDSRAELAIGQLLAGHTATVADFPQVFGEGADARRQMLVTAFDGQTLTSDASTSSDAAAFFAGLTAPFAPSTIAPTPDGLLVTFSFGEPANLLPSVGTPQQ